MALLDRERNLIVLRVVYDGPPEAGKTTSLRALAGSLGQSLYSPAEKDGRTLFFDWMDYTGGRFEGFQIRCQIVSVPGQQELAARRRHLLREADVVVFVADSTREQMGRSLVMLAGLPPVLAGLPGPPVGVLVQANKRDLPDALPLAELRQQVQATGLPIGVVESVAAESTGIRETFVFAVRLALDRVREQLRTHSLRTGVPEVDDGAALLAEMQAADRAPPRGPDLAALAAPALEQVLAENDERLEEYAPWRLEEPGCAAAERAIWPPDPAAPSGAIWPPVEGRLILHEASTPRMTTHLLHNGHWAAGLGSGWRVYSAQDAMHVDLEAGREMLIQWARLHVACTGILSPSRCIVLAATGAGSWRLWQIVRAEISLRQWLDDIDRCTTEEAALRLLEAATLLCDMTARLATAPCHLPCSLDTVARGERGPLYIGLMPMDRTVAEEHERSTELIGSELQSILANELYERRTDVLAALQVARAPRGRPPSQTGLLDQLLGAMVAS